MATGAPAGSSAKAVITSAIGSTGGALGGMVAPDRAGVVPIARRPLTVRQLCQPGSDREQCHYRHAPGDARTMVLHGGA